ncbi:MAG: hypothetical protein KF691_09585 [Phycisphaeraceae bacterium]|nr:hypothetical protein [Phycisphaeraceae bacterium]
MDSGEIHIVSAWGEVGLLRGATDAAILACVERIRTRSNGADRVLLIAGEHGERRAAALGLRTPLVAPPSCLRNRNIRDGLRRVLSRMQRPERLVCWDDALFPRLKNSTVSIWGAALEIVDGRKFDIPVRRVPASTRESIRSALGIGDSEHALILASDPPDSLSAHDFVRASALVGLVGRKVVAIVPRQTQEMERAKATLRSTGVAVRLVTCEAPIWTLLPCADAVVLNVREGSAPRHVPLHSQRWMAETCALLGIPVVWDEGAGSARLERFILRPRSRLAVHVARAINEHFLSSGERLAEPSDQRDEVLA